MQNLNKNEQPKLVKISYDTELKKAINYVLYLLTKGNCESVIICGLSLAISKVILIAEIVKTKIKKIHQINKIDCLITKDKLNETKVKRIPKLDILLTFKEPKDKSDGYQRPLEENEFKLLSSMKNIEEVDDDMNLELDNFNDHIDNEIKSSRKSKNKINKKYTIGFSRKGPRFRLRIRNKILILNK